MKKADKIKRLEERKKREKIKKVAIISSIVLVVGVLIALCIIDSQKNVFVENEQDITTIKFKSTVSEREIEALNGKTVSITGYLSTLSPLNGEFAYLMNMPYQNCPYCVPGTSQITNTLAIFAKENEI